jgi:hypothetical protein
MAVSPVTLDHQLADGFSADHLDSLAKTFDDADQPVWIHDVWARCIYRNPRAVNCYTGDQQTQIFDLLNHEGEVIGYMTTCRGGYRLTSAN